MSTSSNPGTTNSSAGAAHIELRPTVPGINNLASAESGDHEDHCTMGYFTMEPVEPLTCFSRRRE